VAGCAAARGCVAEAVRSVTERVIGKDQNEAEMD
jgi:hypothetical protein